MNEDNFESERPDERDEELRELYEDAQEEIKQNMEEDCASPWGKDFHPFSSLIGKKL